MDTVKFPNIEVYAKELEALGREAPATINMAVYEGAKVLAEAIQKEISGLTELTAPQRKGLHDGLGVARFWEENGATLTRVGFDGYNIIKTRRWPKGQPNVMIARALIRGTSWMMPNKFTDRAARKARAAAIAAMEERINKRLAKTGE